MSSTSNDRLETENNNKKPNDFKSQKSSETSTSQSEDQRRRGNNQSRISDRQSRMSERAGRYSQGSRPKEKVRKGSKIRKTCVDSRKTSRTGKGESQNLAHELDDQLKYRDTVVWSVEVLEQSIAELELQLDALTKGNTDEADTEFKLRYEAQRDLNNKLKEQTEWYSEELASTKEKFNQAQQRASYNLTTLCQEYSYDADLDNYTEAELSVMVRQLERQRNISYSEFRNKTWILDSRSKEYHQLKDLCDAYSGDLSFVNRSLEDMWRKRSNSDNNMYGGIIWSGEAGLRPSQRMLNPRHGPVRKTASVRSLPRLDPQGIDGSSIQGRRTGRTRSLDERSRRRLMAAENLQRHKSAQNFKSTRRRSVSPLASTTTQTPPTPDPQEGSNNDAKNSPLVLN